MAQISAKAPQANASQGHHTSRVLARRETISAYLFMLPSLLFFVGLCWCRWACAWSTVFWTWALTPRPQPSQAFANYIEMFQDETFIRSLWNTVLIVVVSVPVVTAFSLWVGSAIYPMHSKMRSFFRCVFYLRWSPARWPSPWCGSGCSTPTTAC